MELEELFFKSGFLLGASKELIREAINQMNGNGNMSKNELKSKMEETLKMIYELEYETTY